MDLAATAVLKSARNHWFKPARKHGSHNTAQLKTKGFTRSVRPLGRQSFEKLDFRERISRRCAKQALILLISRSHFFKRVRAARSKFTCFSEPRERAQFLCWQHYNRVKLDPILEQRNPVPYSFPVPQPTG